MCSQGLLAAVGTAAAPLYRAPRQFVLLGAYCGFGCPARRWPICPPVRKARPVLSVLTSLLFICHRFAFYCAATSSNGMAGRDGAGRGGTTGPQSVTSFSLSLVSQGFYCSDSSPGQVMYRGPRVGEHCTLCPSHEPSSGRVTGGHLLAEKQCVACPPGGVL